MPDSDTDFVKQLVDSTFADKRMADSLGGFVSYEAKFHTQDSTVFNKDTISFEVEINGGKTSVKYSGTAIKSVEKWRFVGLKRHFLN